jgi:ribosomal protein S18 acetylase RimI-like enzyme
MIFDKSPTSDDIDNFNSELEEYTNSFLKDDYEEFSIVARNEDGLVIAGITGFTVWERAGVNTLWVAENHRGNGIGTKLLAQVEKIASEKGARQIETNSMSFQGTGFFEKNGYKIFGMLDNYPAGYYCNFYTKEI